MLDRGKAEHVRDRQRRIHPVAGPQPPQASRPRRAAKSTFDARASRPSVRRSCPSCRCIAATCAPGSSCTASGTALHRAGDGDRRLRRAGRAARRRAVPHARPPRAKPRSVKNDRRGVQCPRIVSISRADSRALTSTGHASQRVAASASTSAAAQFSLTISARSPGRTPSRTSSAAAARPPRPRNRGSRGCARPRPAPGHRRSALRAARRELVDPAERPRRAERRLKARSRSACCRARSRAASPRPSRATSARRTIASACGRPR